MRLKRSSSRRLGTGMVLSLLLVTVLPAGCAGNPETTRRQGRLVQASIVGTHAWQVKLHRKDGQGDAKAFAASNVTDAQLDALVHAHKNLLASDANKVAKWVEGKPSAFDEPNALGALLDSGLTLDARLPVSTAARVLSERASLHPSAPGGEGGVTGRQPDTEPSVRALANLLQIVLEVNRDGDVLQEQLAFYRSLGLLTGPSDLGIANNDRAFLDLGTTLASQSCKAPYRTNRGEWQMALRKIQNWSLKYRGIGPREYADELLAREDIKPLIPKIKAMKPQRILVLGHSFTGENHWSTLAPMNAIGRAVFEKINPAVTITRMGHGGMNASSARAKYLDKTLALKASHVLIVAVMRSDTDCAAMEEMTRKLTAVGARVACFDQLHPRNNSWINPDLAKLAPAVKAGLHIIKVSDMIATHPHRSRFICLDGIHMTDPYHKAMAARWLKWLVGDSSSGTAK